MAKEETKHKTRRANGAGTLVLQKSGLYLARWAYHGKIMTRSTRVHISEKNAYEKAIAKLDEFVKPFLEASNVAVLENLAARVRTIEKTTDLPEDIEAKARRVKLEDFYDRFMSDVNRGKTVASTDVLYNTVIGKFVAWLDKHYHRVAYADEVRVEMCSEFLSELSKSVSDHTYNHYIILLGYSFKVLLGEKNVWSKFNKRKAENKYERRALTKEELGRLFEVVNALPMEFKLLFYLGVFTGMRVSDCCIIKWEHINFEKGFISLVPLKTKKFKRPTFIPLHPHLRKVLIERWHRTSHHTGYVSPRNAELYLSNHITNYIAPVFVKARIKTSSDDYKGFHMLRHTFVSICANSGVPLAVVQSIVGHSCPEITQHYFHLDYNVCMNAVQKIQVSF